jgi:hypothetical protein
VFVFSAEGVADPDARIGIGEVAGGRLDVQPIGCSMHRLPPVGQQHAVSDAEQV